MTKKRDGYMDVYIYPQVKDEPSKIPAEKTADYLKRLVYVTHSTGTYDREKYVQLIHDICETYNIAKGESGFYQNLLMEKKNEGEWFCDYDNGKGDVLMIKHRIQTNSGAIIIGALYVEKDAEPLTKEDIDNLFLMLRVLTGFISRFRLQAVVERMGFHDESDYPNFRSFARKLFMLNEQKKLPGMIAVHFDLHNYGIINREIGRRNGDIVIRNYFNMIKNAIGEEGCISRLGGDKFIAIFPRNIMDEVLGILSGVPVCYGEHGEHKVEVSAAVGVYEIPNSFVLNSPGDIMDTIMLAAQEAKKSSENAVVYYDESMKLRKDRLVMIQNKFYESLKNRDFMAYYQPKVDVNTKQIVGAEALCRWNDNGRIVPPIEFIPILEQNTEICDLDFYMLDRVCKDLRRRLDAGKEVVRVSVNFSRKHLVDVELLENILKVIDDNNVPHKYIEIELTETTTDVEFRDLKRIVYGLKDSGVFTAVDDFGIGYSSLNLIREIPWDVLKIDRCFLPLDEDDENSITNIMFNHVISMALDIGMECVVEGVETIKQVELLKDNHCDIAQGFYFDKPLPFEEFEKRLDNKGY